jgi:hypothetical protein
LGPIPGLRGHALARPLIKGYRQTLGTTDRREASAKEKELIAQAQAGTLAGGRLGSLARLGFDGVFDRYLAERQIEIQNPRHEADCAKPLRTFFRGKRLNQAAADDIKAYQSARALQGRKPKTVNLEVGLLLRLLKRARLRRLLGDDVRMLPVKREPRQMLTQAEKQRLFETAANRPDWHRAYRVALLTANTSISMRPIELKRLL